MKLRISYREVIETDEKSIVELEDLRDHLLRLVVELDLKLKDAKLKVRLEGEYSDPKWYARTTRNVADCRRIAQRLMMVLADRRRDERRRATLEQRQLPNYFMEVCKQQLPSALYAQFVAEAQARLDAMLLQVGEVS